MGNNLNYTIERFKDLQAERSVLESEWQELSDIFQPGIQDFTSSSEPTWREANRTIDGHGKYLVQKLTAHLFGQLSNPATKWIHFIKDDDSEVVAPTFQNEVDIINKRHLRVFNDHKSNFASETQALYSSMIVFGIGIMYVENRLGKDISFKTIPLSQCYISENHKGTVDTLFRKFKFSAKQLVQAFGMDNVSEQVRKVLDKTPDKEFEIIHAVYPYLNAKRKKEQFTNEYIELGTQHILQKTKIEHFPYFVPRWAKHTGEKYGHGQGKLALSVIRSMTHIRLESHKSLDFSNSPLFLTSDDGVFIPDEITPGSFIEGGLSSMDGQKRIDIINPTGNPAAGLQLYELERDLLNKIFFIEDITMPVDKTRRTATESSLINQDRIRFLAPFISRIESDLSSLVEHVLKLLNENGELDDISPETKSVNLKAEFLSPLARLLKMEDTRASQQFLQASLPLLQFKPELANMINFEEIINNARIGTGSPANILKTPEEYFQALQQQQQQQQAMMEQQNALNASQIAKNVGGLDQPE
jgi:hypothetical protein